jgi:hypothetical protein
MKQQYFYSVNVKQQRTVIPEKEKMNEISPIILPPSYLEIGSILQHRERNL